MERARALQLRLLEERAQREICSAAARCKRQLGEAGAGKVKLDKLRDAIVSGKLLVSVDNRLTANQQRIAALRSRLEVLISRLRTKLRADESTGLDIRALRGRGNQLTFALACRRPAPRAGPRR